MNKILKWVLIVVGVIILLPVVALLIFEVTSPRDAEGHNAYISGMRNDARGDLVVAYIKSAELSVLMFEEDKQKLPEVISDLKPYDPSIVKSEATIRYTKIGEKSFSLCGPYTKESTNEVSAPAKTWSVAGGEICLTEMR